MFITKPEILLAALAATVAGLSLTVWPQRPSIRRIAQLAGTFCAAGLAAPVASFALLSLAMPPADALAGTLGANRWVFSRDITSLSFYRHVMGLHDVPETVGTMIVMFFWYGVLFGVPTILAFMGWRGRKQQIAAAIACFAATAIGLVLCWKLIPTLEMLRPLPFIILAALLIAVVLYVRRHDLIDPVRLALPIALLLFSFLMLGKIMFYARVSHYGFALAMPATLLFVVVLWDWAPAAIEHFGGKGIVLRGAALAVLLVMVANCLQRTSFGMAETSVRVGSGGDAFWADRRGMEVNRLLDELNKLAPSDATLAVVPEGTIFNYLTRRVNPTPYVSLMPVETIIFGQQRILDALKRRPPDFLIVTDESTADYGFRYFGDGYAEEISNWMGANYHAIGLPPARDDEILHGLLMKRNEVEPGSAAKPGSVEQAPPGAPGK